MKFPILLSKQVNNALSQNKPVLALESTVLTHGLPYPENLQVLSRLEQVVRDQNVVPATIIMIEGSVHIGLEDSQIVMLGNMFQSKAHFHKLAERELTYAIASKHSGGTTVSATMRLAYLAGIEVFATGGIGGVHRDWISSADISADLIALSHIPVVVISAGCKAILDIPATIEALETLGVPVLGWQTDCFPAFYSRSSGIKITRTDSIETIANSYLYQKEIYNSNSRPGLLIANPIPEANEIPISEIEPIIAEGIAKAHMQKITGKELTPFLLDFLARRSKGVSVSANLALLENNARLGAEIAKAISEKRT